MISSARLRRFTSGASDYMTNGPSIPNMECSSQAQSRTCLEKSIHDLFNPIIDSPQDLFVGAQP
ncbi:hypothetical protein ACFL0H_04990 [Thermodesulfobacteriota bacterium]